MATRILMVRHAAHDLLGRVLAGRMPGVRLGAAGRLESLRLAERLQGQRIAAIYVSPLERAKETAAPIAARQGVTVVESESIHEIDFGLWSGMSFRALSRDPAWAYWNANRGTARAPRGESMPEVQARILDHLRDIERSHPGETVALVSHGDVIKSALVHFLNCEISAIDRIQVRPASISAVVLHGGRGEVERMDESVSS